DRFWLARLVRNPLVLDRLVVRPLGCDKLSLPELPGGVRFGTRLLVARERQDVCLPSLRKCGRRLVDERLPIVAGNSKSLMARGLDRRSASRDQAIQEAQSRQILNRSR